MNILFTAALREEVAPIADADNVLITGVGKVNAAHELTKELVHRKGDVDLVVNLGTAGSGVKEFQNKVQCCCGYTNGDLNKKTSSELCIHDTIYPRDHEGYKLNNPWELMDNRYDPKCISYDSFVEDMKDDIPVVYDMEAYALANVCQKENVPFCSFKYISDAGNFDDWRASLPAASKALVEVYDKVCRLYL